MGDVVARFVESDVDGMPDVLGDEKPWLEWELPWLQDAGDGRGFPPGQRGTIPLMVSLRARRDP